MFGWNAKTPQSRTFGDIYHQQYRQQKGTMASKLSGAGVPLSIFFGVFVRHRGPTFAIIMGVLAVVLFAAAVILTRRDRRAKQNNAQPPATPG